MEQPHHSGQETATPISPQFARVAPSAAGRVAWQIIGISMDQRTDLVLGKVERALKTLNKSGGVTT
jgi:hypothetical protein